MSSNLETRLRKVEREQTPADLPPVYIVHGPDETPEEAEERYFAEHPTDRGRPVWTINTGITR